MTDIFISYRRSDSGDEVKQLYEYLCKRYGDRYIFMDVQNIKYGEEFETKLREVVGNCSIFLLLIGNQWLPALKGKAESREKDYVKLEISHALKMKKCRLVPVLVNGAAFPKPGDLPESIRGITRYNAASIRKEHMFSDLDSLGAYLDEIMKQLLLAEKLLGIGGISLLVSIVGTIVFPPLGCLLVPIASVLWLIGLIAHANSSGKSFR